MAETSIRQLRSQLGAQPAGQGTAASCSAVASDEKPAFYDFANDTPKLTGAEVVAAFRVQSGE